MSNLPKNKQCFFCTTNKNYIDYKDVDLIKRFISASAKIFTRRKSNLCAYHQRKLAVAVKRARYMALLPYTSR